MIVLVLGYDETEDRVRELAVLVRLVDYECNEGGAIRFVTQVLRALVAAHSSIRFELVSCGSALRRYREKLSAGGTDVLCTEKTPRGHWKQHLIDVLRVPGTTGLRRSPAAGPMWHFEVPKELFLNCDVGWCPSLYRHRLPAGSWRRVVGTFHDDIFLRFARAATGHPHSFFVGDEEETIRGWLKSEARIVVSSHSTAAAVAERFKVAANRFDVIPIAATHAYDWALQAQRPAADWARGPYLVCPASLSAHKNHEALFEGVAQWGARWPLILTGSGSAALGQLGLVPWVRVAGGLRLIGPGRVTRLRELARTLGLRLGTAVIPLGLVPDEEYFGILSHAAALVMPTLAEGGGSFPVGEAIHLGVPVLCSDIPVLREQVARLNADVLFFDPCDPRTLAARLDELERNYDGIKAKARLQVRRLSSRSWYDVATEYWELMASVACQSAGRS
jgi:glycosyltransferase involved in cell wall biosynthesis